MLFDRILHGHLAGPLVELNLREPEQLLTVAADRGTS
jgi:hypothetical protein